MSFTINTVTLSGNLTRDPELRSLPSGTSVCELGLAVNERTKQNGEWVDRANYFDVTVWGGTGEWVAANLVKGDRLVVQGRLRFESWEKDGQKRSKVKVVAESLSTGGRSGGGTGGSGGGGFASRDESVGGDFAAPSSSEFAPVAGASATDADDIPFAYEDPFEYDWREYGR